MAKAGLERRSAYATATLVIAANIPDVDVLVFATDTPAITFRRGWTHGVIAQALLPIAVTLLMLAWARWRRPSGPRPLPTGPPLRPWTLLALAYAGLYSHLFLDFLNNYGVRLLAPIEWRWWYGDAVFIVDPWLWVALGAGVWLAVRWRSVGPAQMALIAASAYITFMLGTAAVARDAVTRDWQARRGYPPDALMVGPVPLSPLVHEVIIDAGDRYETGTYRFWAPRLQLDAGSTAKHADAPEVAAARQARPIRAFLVWSRFPYWEVQRTPTGAVVTVRDMRFRGGAVRFEASTLVQ